MSAMALQLSLPPMVGQTAPDVDVAATERWLANLPVLNVSETSHQLFMTLSTLNRRPLDSTVLFRILELYRRPIEVISAEQQKRYLGLPVPLPMDRRPAADRTLQFQVELAYGYKRVVLGLSEHPILTPEARSALAQAVQRAIRCLTKTLLRSYEVYAAGPEGTWREIHQLYQFAEAEAATELPVADNLNAAVVPSGVAHAYKQALLLGFSDPFHMPAQLLQKIDSYLDAYAPLAQLTLFADALKPECEFLVDLEQDRAGVAGGGNADITPQRRYRLLATVALARTLHQHITTLRTGAVPDDALGRNFYSNRGQELLARLITAWGVNPKRLFSRAPKTGTRVEIARGITHISRCLGNGSTFVPSTSDVGPQPARSEISGQQKESGIYMDRTGGSGESWELLDEGAGGFSFGTSRAADRPLQVGDLIAVRLGGEQTAWTIAVVRWARSSTPDRIEFGAERLAPAAEAVAVVASDSPGGEFMTALRLPEIRTLRRPHTLVTPCGLFRPQRILILDDGYRSRPVRATRLLNLSSSFEQFEFASPD